MPSCLDCRAASRLAGFLPELAGLLHHRGEAIAGRLADARRGGTAEIADYMMLQMINRYEPVVNHLAQITGLHPLGLYQQLRSEEHTSELQSRGHLRCRRLLEKK